MNETPEKDLDIQEVMKMSLVNDEPSEELMRNLRVLAAKTLPRRQYWPRGLAISSGVAVAVAVVALSMVPRNAPAKSYDLLLAAAGRVNSFLFTVDAKTSSKNEQITVAGIDGKFSLRSSDGPILQIDGGSFRAYDPKDNTLTELKLGNELNPEMVSNMVQKAMADGFKEMNLKKALKDYEHKYGRDHIQISPISHEDGKDVYHVTMDSPKESGRVEMVVDASTDLPDRIDINDPNSKEGRSEHTVIQMQFGSQIDPRLVTPDFPKNAKKVEIDLGSMIGGAMNGGLQSLGAELGKDPELKNKMKDFGKQIHEALDKDLKKELGSAFGAEMNKDVTKGN